VTNGAERLLGFGETHPQDVYALDGLSRITHDAAQEDGSPSADHEALVVTVRVK